MTGCHLREVVYGARAPSAFALMGQDRPPRARCRVRGADPTLHGHLDVGPPTTICAGRTRRTLTVGSVSVNRPLTCGNVKSCRSNVGS